MRGEKQEAVLELLGRPQGATLAQLQTVTGWLPHTVRGYLSGHVGKRLGKKVVRVQTSDGAIYKLETERACSVRK